MKSDRDLRRRTINALLRAAAAGDRSSDLLADLHIAYTRGGVGERSRITRRLQGAGYPEVLINRVRGVER